MSKDYKDIAEITAYHSLNYLKNKLNITHEFYKGWKDALVGGEEIYYVGIVKGEPHLERINPIYFDYDTDTSDLEFIHEAQWCCYEMIMSVTEVYDRLYDKMSEKQLNDLLDMMNWNEKSKPPQALQKELVITLNEQERTLTDIMANKETCSIDELYLKSGLSSSAAAQALLMLEMNGIIRSLPGKLYQLA